MVKYAVETVGLTRKFGDLVAVDHVNLRVGFGQVFGLLGPNAAGKTTTIRMLCTVLAPTEGTARVNGYDVVRESRKVRDSIGVLPEDTGLYDRLSAKETLRYYGRLHRMGGDALEDRIDGLLNLLGLTDRERDRVATYSKGMRQKLALARAFIHDPPILFLDEPTAGLDVMSARTIRKLIRDIAEEKRAIVLSTHNMVEAQQLCTRLVIINKGRIVAEGTVQELEAMTREKGLEEVFVHLIREEA